MSYHRNPLLGGVLSTDQYQLTMAQLYWREGLADHRAQFDYFFRSYPDYGTHQAGYCVTAGLDWLLEWMDNTRFIDEDLAELRSQVTPAGERRFDEGFLEWLEENGDFSSVSLSAVQEGRVVHAHVPIVVAQGPLAMTQILETALLNRLNYPTLIATKASRVKEAARGRPVMEFGMRRGPESGADAGGRAALIGGCDFTSNVALSHAMGTEPKGTHAHSMVQAFMAVGAGELAAFRAFARSYPDECILLVDTIDTLESGVPNAIRVFEELRARGHRPGGIRLDSGDLAYLAIQSAKLLDGAGFADVPIVLSSDLDELAIWQILSQIDDEAPRYGIHPEALSGRLIYGVGTRLITSHGDSSLDGVFKLTAMKEGGTWWPAVKVSESSAKVPVPGEKAVWRVYDRRGYATADVIAHPDEDLLAAEELRLFHPHREASRTMAGVQIEHVESLLEPVYSGGQEGPPASLEAMRERRTHDLGRLDQGVRRIVTPHIYHVSLTERMKSLQRELVNDARASA